MAKHIRTLTVYYDMEINYREIPLFRGAVLNSMGSKANLLYHNHTGADTFRYAYPLIQYKRLGGKAAMVCVEQGADVIGQFLSESDGTMMIGERKVKCSADKVAPVRILVQTWKSSFRYHINRWLPLNTKNYRVYQMTDDENEKKTLLENILKANLLSMLKGLDIHLEDELLLRITQLSKPYIIYNKGIALMAFNADFTCNLSIPNNLGIGKNASIGCGVVHQQRKNNDHNKTTIAE
ncbi:MAG: hypothetical protein IJ549_05870 [Prevotella sp.]|nr:hypothetical protein [Prevotella sp.]